MSPRLSSTEWDLKYYMQAPPCDFSFERLTCLGRFPAGSCALTTIPRCWIDRIRPRLHICWCQACTRSSGKVNLIHWYNLLSIKLALHLFNSVYPSCVRTGAIRCGIKATVTACFNIFQYFFSTSRVCTGSAVCAVWPQHLLFNPGDKRSKLRFTIAWLRQKVFQEE